MLVPVASTVTLIAKTSTPILALAANFTPIPLCNPLTNQKYVSGAACTAIASCNLVALQAQFCSGENKPLVCVNNYYFDPLLQVCAQVCSNNAPRSPGTITTNAICNYGCAAVEVGVKCNYGCNNTSLCPNSSFALLSNLPNNFLCAGGFNRMGYKCTNVAAKDSKLI